MSSSKIYQIKSEDQIGGFAKSFISDLKHNLVLFIGDLGAGKTTIIKALLKELGSEDIGSSPSYAIINKYIADQGPVFHIDLYRLNTAEEVFQLGIEEILYADNKCFMEWPQLIIDYIDPPYHTVKIEVLEDNSRKISML